ncbi:hypothetical protein G9A89_002037 [Geosiphon pyriformis]|nr:hypothetical protein G9A89_002037 [Geosiphon pyriformis]
MAFAQASGSSSSSRPYQQQQQHPYHHQRTSSSLSVFGNSQEQYQPSFFRRAWDKVESILTQNPNKTTSYLNNDEDDDELLEEEFHNPLNPHRRQILKEGSISSRMSADSGDERPFSRSSSRPVSRASSMRRYDPWQQRVNDELEATKVEHAQIKDMISGWAMGEVGPWFD